jgi:flagellar protein FlaG
MQPINSTLPSVTLPSSPQATAAKPVTPRPEAKPETVERPSFQQLEQAARRIEKFVQPISSDLQFSVDEASGSQVVRVIDRATQQVIRQMPSEEMLAIASALDRLQGLLVRQQA